MAHRNASSSATGAIRNPQVTSYDSGYEHSLEHWTEVQRMVQESAAEAVVVNKSADHGILVAA